MNRPESARSVTVFAKKKFGLDVVINYLRRHFRLVTVFTGSTGDPFPAAGLCRKTDICVSYMSPWIIPARVLRQTRVFSVNFHPGTPGYRGIGCTNFALYNGERRYGVTAHHMAAGVDRGPIIAVRRFALLPDENLLSVTSKCYVHILTLFHEVFDHYLEKGALPCSKERWSSRLYTRQELDDLCRLNRQMSASEIERRKRATDFPGMPKASFAHPAGVPLLGSRR